MSGTAVAITNAHNITGEGGRDWAVQESGCAPEQAACPQDGTSRLAGPEAWITGEEDQPATIALQTFSATSAAPPDLWLLSLALILSIVALAAWAAVVKRTRSAGRLLRPTGPDFGPAGARHA